MPQRKSVVRVESPEAQGEGSYIEFRKFSWGEQKELMRKFDALDAGTVASRQSPVDSPQSPDGGQRSAVSDQRSDENARVEKVIAEIEQIIVERLVGWNWVNNDGVTMALPKTREDLNALLDDEIAFLMKALRTATRGLSEDERKN